MKDCLYYTINYAKTNADTSIIDYHIASFLRSTTTERYSVLTNHPIRIQHPRLDHIRIDKTITELLDIKSAKCRIERYFDIDRYSGIFQFDWDVIFQNNLTKNFEECFKPDIPVISMCGNNRSKIVNKLKVRLCSSIFYFPASHYHIFRDWTDRLTPGSQEEHVMVALMEKKYPGLAGYLPKYAWWANMGGLEYFDYVHFGLERKVHMANYYTKRWGNPL